MLVLRVMKTWKPSVQNILLVVYLLVQFKDRLGLLLLLGFIAFVLFFTYALLAYRRFKFKIDEGVFHVYSGVFQSKHTEIPLARIQAVHLEQNALFQLFDMAGLQIETAGSAKEEISIDALHLLYARELKAVLLSESMALAKPEEVTADGNINTGFIIQLSFKNLFLLGLSRNHLRSLMAMVAFGWFWYVQYQDFSGAQGDDMANSLHEAFLILYESNLTIWLIGVLFISVLLSTATTGIRYFKFEALFEGEALQIRTGLFKRYSDEIKLSKIQFMQWQSNVLERLLGFESLALSVARSGPRASRRKLMIPACSPNQSAQVLKELEFSEDFQEDMLQFGPKRTHFMVLLALHFCLALALGMLIYSQIPLLTSAMVCLTYLGVFIFISYKYTQSIRLKINEDCLLIEKGWIVRRRWLMRYYKVQGVGLSQNLLQRKRKTTHLTLFTAAGNLSLKYFAQSTGEGIRNMMLARIEQSTETWM